MYYATCLDPDQTFWNRYYTTYGGGTTTGTDINSIYNFQQIDWSYANEVQRNYGFNGVGQGNTWANQNAQWGSATYQEYQDNGYANSAGNGYGWANIIVGEPFVFGESAVQPFTSENYVEYIAYGPPVSNFSSSYYNTGYIPIASYVYYIPYSQVYNVQTTLNSTINTTIITFVQGFSSSSTFTLWWDTKSGTTTTQSTANVQATFIHDGYDHIVFYYAGSWSSTTFPTNITSFDSTTPPWKSFLTNNGVLTNASTTFSTTPITYWGPSGGLEITNNNTSSLFGGYGGGDGQNYFHPINTYYYFPYAYGKLGTSYNAEILYWITARPYEEGIVTNLGDSYDDDFTIYATDYFNFEKIRTLRTYVLTGSFATTSFTIFPIQQFTAYTNYYNNTSQTVNAQTVNQYYLGNNIHTSLTYSPRVFTYEVSRDAYAGVFGSPTELWDATTSSAALQYGSITTLGLGTYTANDIAIYERYSDGEAVRLIQSPLTTSIVTWGLYYLYYTYPITTLYTPIIQLTPLKTGAGIFQYTNDLRGYWTGDVYSGRGNALVAGVYAYPRGSNALLPISIDKNNQNLYRNLNGYFGSASAFQSLTIDIRSLFSHNEFFDINSIILTNSTFKTSDTSFKFKIFDVNTETRTNTLTQTALTSTNNTQITLKATGYQTFTATKTINEQTFTYKKISQTTDFIYLSLGNPDNLSNRDWITEYEYRGNPVYSMGLYIGGGGYGGYELGDDKNVFLPYPNSCVETITEYNPLNSTTNSFTVCRTSPENVVHFDRGIKRAHYPGYISQTLVHTTDGLAYYKDFGFNKYWSAYIYQFINPLFTTHSPNHKSFYTYFNFY